MSKSSPHWTDSVYAEVTDQIIRQLEAGTIPWRKPWNSGCFAATNLVSRKAYRGINAIVLGFTGFASPYWVTYNQARALGGNVRKGAKSSLVIFYKLVEKKDRQGRPVLNDFGRPVGFPMLRYSRVFNLEQTEGIEAPASEVTKVTPEQADTAHLEKARDVASAWHHCPVHIGAHAGYSPSMDSISMPAVRDFDCEESYLHTLFHEMAHATGTKDRLNRDGVTSKEARFGTEEYSKEELVAELAASFVSNVTGILSHVGLQQSAAYVANWLKVLKDDRKMVVVAASAAQKAADYILHNTEDKTAEDESK